MVNREDRVDHGRIKVDRGEVGVQLGDVRGGDDGDDRMRPMRERGEDELLGGDPDCWASWCSPVSRRRFSGLSNIGHNGERCRLSSSPYTPLSNGE